MTTWCSHGYGADTCPHCSPIQLNGQVERLHATIESLRAEIERLRAEVENDNASLHHFKKNNDALRAELTEAIRQRDKFFGEANLERNQAAALREYAERLREALELYADESDGSGYQVAQAALALPKPWEKP